MFTLRDMAAPALALVLGYAAPASSYATEASAVPPHSVGPARFDLLTGQFWRRLPDPRHPAAPPKLVAVEASPASAGSTQGVRALCQRAGDHILLHSAGAQSLMRIEAIALESGRPGDRVRARVTVTGSVVLATVVEAGVGVLTAAQTQEPR